VLVAAVKVIFDWRKIYYLKIHQNRA